MNKKFADNLFKLIPHPLIKYVFNLWPPFRGAGIKVDYIAPDYRTMEVSMKLGLLNRNYVGTHFGGSLFAMTDACPMVMLLKNLGPHYVVWDKEAKIEFKKPARGKIIARCEFSDNDINLIRSKADQEGKTIFDKKIDLVNEQNEVVATTTKTIYVRRKN